MHYMRNIQKTIPYILGCAAIVFVAYQATVHNVAKDFEVVKAKINLEGFPEKELSLKNAFIGEIQTIFTHNNPEINPKIKYVFVLSARHDYNKNTVTSSPQNANAYDKNDGFDRMNLGIDIARKVAAMNADKSDGELTDADIITYGPRIIYNGEKESNDVLTEVLEEGRINYPSEKFAILPLNKDQVHTKGQFESLKNNASAHNINLANALMAIVTHGYHWSRTGRIDAVNYFPHTTIVAHLVDRQFTANGVSEELRLEALKLPGYIEKGFILRELNKDVQYNGNARF